MSNWRAKNQQICVKYFSDTSLSASNRARSVNGVCPAGTSPCGNVTATGDAGATEVFCTTSSAGCPITAVGIYTTPVAGMTCSVFANSVSVSTLNTYGTSQVITNKPRWTSQLDADYYTAFVASPTLYLCTAKGTSPWPITASAISLNPPCYYQGGSGSFGSSSMDSRQSGYSPMCTIMATDSGDVLYDPRVLVADIVPDVSQYAVNGKQFPSAACNGAACTSKACPNGDVFGGSCTTYTPCSSTTCQPPSTTVSSNYPPLTVANLKNNQDQYYWGNIPEIAWYQSCPITRTRVIELQNSGNISTVVQCALGLLVVAIIMGMICDMYYTIKSLWYDATLDKSAHYVKSGVGIIGGVVKIGLLWGGLQASGALVGAFAAVLDKGDFKTLCTDKWTGSAFQFMGAEIKSIAGYNLALIVLAALSILAAFKEAYDGYKMHSTEMQQMD